MGRHDPRVQRRDRGGDLTAPLLACTGCGRAAPDDPPFPARCAAAGDGRDHVLARTGVPEGAVLEADDDPNPFVRFRALAYPWQVARRRGLSDAEYVGIVRRLDDAVARVDGRGFTLTPWRRAEGLDPALGARLWLKDETGGVSGSHKARHLFGLAIGLEVAARTGVGSDAPLAIASCGNAALAAAVVARAAGRRLRVFVPTWAEAPVLDRLAALGAAIEACPRERDRSGDPCVARFRAAVAEGAVPFCCQGSENGLTIDGGMTLGFEIATQDAALGMGPLDRLFVQVGGGALASATSQGLAWAHALGKGRPPALHAVQTEGGYPLVRAWRRVAEALVRRLGGAPGDDAAMARRIVGHPDAIDTALRDAATRRAAFMWPWEEEPHSAATGILDDEAYDWLAVVRGMLETGGWPVVVPEATIRRAHAEGRATTGLDASATGTAGLAGALELARQGLLRPDERVAVLFTGVQR